MEYRMKTLTARFIVATAMCVWIAGCSGSEETAGGGERAPEGFRTVDKEEVVIPASETPPDVATEAPPKEAEAAVPQRHPSSAPENADAPQRTKDPVRSGVMMWSVQIGAFRAEAGADQLFSEVRNKFSHPVYKDFDAVSGLYKVTVGSFPTREQAARFKEEVLDRGYTGAFAVEVMR
jgi:cell division septation protein DedD